MKPKTILSYWCSPFLTFENFAGLSEVDIYKEGNPIVFIGGRGSGKTMFLRYWSYEVQKELYSQTVQELHSSDLFNYLNTQGGLGVYLRIDGPVLRSFEGYGLTKEKWNSIFIQYFELVTARACVNILKDVVEESQFDLNSEEQSFCEKLYKPLGAETKFNSLSDIIELIDERIEEITDYRGEIAFVNKDFKPTKAFASQSLSFKVPIIAKSCFQQLSEDFNFIFFIDEFENFLPEQQRMINTLFKFVKPGITFRIGMRLEGFRTYYTVNNDDFIKEGRDYQKVVFEDILDPKGTGYQKYLNEIAKKRLERVPLFRDNDLTDISKFLGSKENLEQEALDMVGNKKKHFKFFDKALPKSKIESIKAKKNPLLELLGLVWLVRGAKLDDRKLSADEISQGIRDYQRGNKTELSKKIQYDYINKYKLSLMILLCSIYRENKGYYSFNTFCYLSSGIVGHFLELCRYSFRYAEFENKEALFKGTIGHKLQTKAARQYATKELQQVKRIEDHGTLLYQMAENLGNIFREYHRDVYIRYPETNQFSLDLSKLTDNDLNAFQAALKWSIIIKKPNLQQASPGERRTEIYTLNRIYSPEFNISYRTRGGINEQYDARTINLLMTKAGIKPQKNLNKKVDEKILGVGQQSIDYEE